MRILFVCTLILLFPVHSFSEQLIKVGILQSIEVYRPAKLQEIKEALISTGLPFEFTSFPNERALRLAIGGFSAMDIYRQPSTMKNAADMIRINTPVDYMEGWLFTHPDTPSLCDIHTFKEQTVVGVLGAHWYEDFIYPRFKDHKVVLKFAQAFKLVANRFVALSFAGRDGIEKEMNETGLAVKICGTKPFQTFKIYTYVHKDFAWIIPLVEQAYARHFPSTGRLPSHATHE